MQFIIVLIRGLVSKTYNELESWNNNDDLFLIFTRKNRPYALIKVYLSLKYKAREVGHSVYGNRAKSLA